MSKNLATTTIVSHPGPPTSATSVTVATGTGSRLYAGMAVIHPANATPTPANAEVVSITDVSGDTLTIVRAQESSTARAIATGDVITQGITAAMWDSLVASNAGKAAASHTHSAADIASGTFGLARGGTGGTDAATARTNLGLGTAAVESPATLAANAAFTGTYVPFTGGTSAVDLTTAASVSVPAATANAHPMRKDQADATFATQATLATYYARIDPPDTTVQAGAVTTWTWNVPGGVGLYSATPAVWTVRFSVRNQNNAHRPCGEYPIQIVREGGNAFVTVGPRKDLMSDTAFFGLTGADPVQIGFSVTATGNVLTVTATKNTGDTLGGIGAVLARF